MTDPKHSGPTEPERRGALRALIVLGSAAYAGALAVPAAAYMIPSGSSDDGTGTARWIRVARLSEISPGEPKRVPVIADARDAFTVTKDELLGSVWLLRDGDKVRALSATCPHLGCSVDLGADKKSFACPCHTSRFRLDGATDSGPAPRAMDALETRVVGEWVEVDFRRFRIGVSERQEVGA